MATVPLRWARIVRDLRVDEAFLGQQVSKDLLEPAQGLAFKRPPQPQLRTVRAEPLAESWVCRCFLCRRSRCRPRCRVLPRVDPECRSVHRFVGDPPPWKTLKVHKRRYRTRSSWHSSYQSPVRSPNRRPPRRRVGGVSLRPGRRHAARARRDCWATEIPCRCNASVVDSGVWPVPLTGISRSGHLHVKTPAGLRGILPSAGSMSMARCTGMCGLRERSV